MRFVHFLLTASPLRTVPGKGSVWLLLPGIKALRTLTNPALQQGVHSASSRGPQFASGLPQSEVTGRRHAGSGLVGRGHAGSGLVGRGHRGAGQVAVVSSFADAGGSGPGVDANHAMAAFRLLGSLPTG